MLHVVAGESDSWDSQQVWRKPASVQRVCKDLIVSVAGGPVKAVSLRLVTKHSPSGNLWGQRNTVCLASWAACCENFLCEKKLSNGASCYAVQFESKVTAKASESRWESAPKAAKSPLVVCYWAQKKYHLETWEKLRWRAKRGRNGARELLSNRIPYLTTWASNTDPASQCVKFCVRQRPQAKTLLRESDILAEGFTTEWLFSLRAPAESSCEPAPGFKDPDCYGPSDTTALSRAVQSRISVYVSGCFHLRLRVFHLFSHWENPCCVALQFASLLSARGSAVSLANAAANTCTSRCSWSVSTFSLCAGWQWVPHPAAGVTPVSEVPVCSSGCQSLLACPEVSPVLPRY